MLEGMLPLTLFIFEIFELYKDMQLALKIFVLITLISFIKNHLGTGALGIAVMAATSFFILFDLWWFFGGIYVLYTLLVLGFSSVIIDMFFVSGMTGTGMGGGEHKGTTADAAVRMQRIKMMNRMMHPPRMGR